MVFVQLSISKDPAETPNPCMNPFTACPASSGIAGIWLAERKWKIEIRMRDFIFFVLSVVFAYWR